MNWKWPSTERNNLVPWYVAAWRMFWFCSLTYPGLFIAALGVLFARGPHEAAAWLNEVVNS
jgi:hypothetical protein